MLAAQRLEDPAVRDMETRLASLRLATGRRVRLEGLFADRAFLNKTLEDGRYLRLCAAIAWASAREEDARRAVETDMMVANLRDSVAANRPGFR
jgi:hypothetical protein